MKPILTAIIVTLVLLMATACPLDTVPGLSSEKAITNFVFTSEDNPELSADVSGSIYGTEISISVPFGTDVTTLVASFTTTGNSVSISGTEQISGTTANDFTSPVIYSVQAEDDSIRDFRVTVSVAENTAKEITDFRFTPAPNSQLSEDVIGIIEGTDISLRVPYGTEVTSLVATFTTTGESVKIGGNEQFSGTTAIDFTNPVTYTVQAEDDSIQEYLVCVTIAGITRTELIQMVNNGEDVTNVDISDITDMNQIFYRAEDFNQDISSWDVSHVTNMRAMFLGAINFNQDISSWDVSNVTDMSSMFRSAVSFNQHLSSWDVSSVTDMHEMFYNAEAFNGNISSWDVSSVTNMQSMFDLADAFNQDISSWDVSGVTNMQWMFYFAKAFNQDISSWDVSNVTDMNGMFYLAEAFNQDISSWDVTNVTDMGGMFYLAKVFNQDISSWDVTNVTEMYRMFYFAEAFNQDISSWSDHVDETISHSGFSDGCPLEESNHPYPSWDD